MQYIILDERGQKAGEQLQVPFLIQQKQACNRESLGDSLGSTSDVRLGQELAASCLQSCDSCRVINFSQGSY